MPLTPRQLVPAKIALLIGLTCVAYFPALRGGFIFDDKVLLTDNTLVKAPDGWCRFWYSTRQPDYVPLTSCTLWMEWRLWGMDSAGYHISNVVLHIVSVLLVWRLLWRLSVGGAFLAALLWAVHPVNVESVAWIAQRKDVLATAFFLLSILMYLRADEAGNTNEKKTGREEQKEHRAIWYWMSLLAFLLSMFSKGSVAILPVVLLLIVWWKRRRITSRDLTRTAPFFLVAAVLTAVDIWFVTRGTGMVIREATLSERLLGAGAVVWFYLSKSLLPINLNFVYPQWTIEPGRLEWWLPVLAALFVTAALLWRWNSPQSNWGRALLFAWGFYCMALVPVLGFTDVGFMQYSLVADHYQHIAVIGVVALAAAAWSAWHKRSIRLANVAALLVVAGFTFFSFQQSRLYADAIDLYQATLERNPTCWVVHYNLAVELNENGAFQDALQHYQAAVRLNPDFIEARNNLGIALGQAGRWDEAIECFRKSLEFQPDRAITYFNLGNALAHIERAEEAVAQFQEAVRLKPDYAEAWANLAACYGDLERWDEALPAAKKALELAQSQGQTAVSQAIEDWLARHRDQQDGAQASPRSRPATTPSSD